MRLAIGRSPLGVSTGVLAAKENPQAAALDFMRDGGFYILTRASGELGQRRTACLGHQPQPQAGRAADGGRR